MPDSPCHDDNTTTTTSPTVPANPDLHRRCPVCWTAFTPVRRRQYCSDNCRKTAWARRRAAAVPPVPTPPAGRRRDSTIYACPQCDTRFHGQQWCPDCNQPCTRIGLGGPCPHWDGPVAVTDLLTPQEATTS